MTGDTSTHSTPTAAPHAGTPRVAGTGATAIERPTTVSPDARTLWRRGRGLLLGAAVLLVTGLLLALLNTGQDEALHPRSPTPHGSRALAELLKDRGVTVTLVTTAAEAAAAAGPDTTLLVARPDTLTDQQLGTVRRAATAGDGRTVVVGADQDALTVLAPGVLASDPVEVSELAPACTPRSAAPDSPGTRAGSADLGGYGYHAGDPLPAHVSLACYPLPDAPLPLHTLLTLREGTGGDTVLLGAPDILQNEDLDERGNASLALQLLGTRPHLAWYLPSAADAPAADDEKSLTELLDPGWRWAALQLAIAAGIAAVWRGRRLGPIVTEPLPVTVRAAETTEGRARLYHQAGARGRAAEALRAACRERLAPLVGVPPAATHSAEALPASVAARAGVSPATAHALLFGPPPADDQALVHLADDLDALVAGVAPSTSTSTDRTHGAADRPTGHRTAHDTDKDRAP